MGTIAGELRPGMIYLHKNTNQDFTDSLSKTEHKTADTFLNELIDLFVKSDEHSQALQVSSSLAFKFLAVLSGTSFENCNELMKHLLNLYSQSQAAKTKNTQNIPQERSSNRKRKSQPRRNVKSTVLNGEDSDIVLDTLNDDWREKSECRDDVRSSDVERSTTSSFDLSVVKQEQPDDLEAGHAESKAKWKKTSAVAQGQPCSSQPTFPAPPGNPNTPPPIFMDYETVEAETSEGESRLAGGGKKTKKIAPIHLSHLDQDDIIDWFKASPCLYDKGHADYKLFQLKNSMWEEKAGKVADGKYSGARIKIWLESLRSQYGKLSKRAMGSGPRISDRDKWILNKFNFLDRHIYRITKRTGLDLMATVPIEDTERKFHTPQTALSADDTRSEIGDMDTKSMYGGFTTPLAATDTSWGTSGRGVKRKRLNEESSRLANKLKCDGDVLPERQQWGEWFSASLPHIHPSLWAEFQTASLQLVESFRQRSQELELEEQNHQEGHFSQPFSEDGGDDPKVVEQLEALSHYQSPEEFLSEWQTKF